jgi:hypothetical protein
VLLSVIKRALSQCRRQGDLSLPVTSDVRATVEGVKHTLESNLNHKSSERLNAYALAMDSAPSVCQYVLDGSSTSMACHVSLHFCICHRLLALFFPISECAASEWQATHVRISCPRADVGCNIGPSGRCCTPYCIHGLQVTLL